MGTILFFIFPAPGHINPSLKLAKSLRERKHRVCYVGAQGSEAEVAIEGFEYISIFKQGLGGGNGRASSTDVSIRQLVSDQISIVYGHKEAMIEMIDDLKPDLFVIDNLLPAVALVALEVGVPSLFLNVTFNAFDDYEGTLALAPLQRVPEMVFCPQEFDLPKASYGIRRRFYIEPSIDQARVEVDFPWEAIAKDRPLIYCSLGTQSHFFLKESLYLYDCLIEAMRQREDWQLILSIGTHLNTKDYRSAPPNVLIVNRAPQMEVLRRASLMITHGGLGSIKECIFFGVPMIVFPLGRDQPRNAARVVHHGLGARGDLRNISVEIVQSLIDKIDKNPSFRANVERMKKSFHDMEEARRGAKIIEKIIGVMEKKEAPRLMA